jgi:hypothetical protein
VLTPGNHKLGGRLIWGFGLPSGRPEVCVGLSAECRRHCYARQVEGLRPAVLACYENNLRLSRLPQFARRLRAFIRAHDIAVVRVHTAGDFYDAAYARKWLRVMQRLPAVRFFFYTRSWRDAAIRPVLEQMAGLPHCRAWYARKWLLRQLWERRKHDEDVMVLADMRRSECHRFARLWWSEGEIRAAQEGARPYLPYLQPAKLIELLVASDSWAQRGGGKELQDFVRAGLVPLWVVTRTGHWATCWAPPGSGAVVLRHEPEPKSENN